MSVLPFWAPIDDGCNKGLKAENAELKDKLREYKSMRVESLERFAEMEAKVERLLSQSYANQKIRAKLHAERDKWKNEASASRNIANMACGVRDDYKEKYDKLQAVVDEMTEESLHQTILKVFNSEGHTNLRDFAKAIHTMIKGAINVV